MNVSITENDIEAHLSRDGLDEVPTYLQNIDDYPKVSKRPIS